MYTHARTYMCVYMCVYMCMYMHLEGCSPCPQEKSWQSGCQVKEDLHCLTFFYTASGSRLDCNIRKYISLLCFYFLVLWFSWWILISPMGFVCLFGVLFLLKEPINYPFNEKPGNFSGKSLFRRPVFIVFWKRLHQTCVPLFCTVVLQHFHSVCMKYHLPTPQTWLS